MSSKRMIFCLRELDEFPADEFVDVLGVTWHTRGDLHTTQDMDPDPGAIPGLQTAVADAVGERKQRDRSE